MAEKVVIFEADINAEEAIKETQRLKQRVAELKDKTDDLKGKYGESSNEYIKALIELECETNRYDELVSNINKIYGVNPNKYTLTLIQLVNSLKYEFA